MVSKTENREIFLQRQNKKEPHSYAILTWVQGRDLNPRPPGYEPDELPTALPCDIFTCSLVPYHYSRLARKKQALFLGGLPLAKTARADYNNGYKKHWAEPVQEANT
jgi:hypothetical protein